MGFALRQTVAPTGEPLSLADLKSWLRVDSGDTSQDDRILDLITTAREYCEEYTQRQFLPATWQLTLDYFPGVYYSYPGREDTIAHWWYRNIIYLPRPPFRAMSSIQYVDTAGVTQTLASTEYNLDTVREPARIRPAYGKIWPVTRVQLDAVTLTYTAGYDDGSVLPARVKQAMRLLVGLDYENREATEVNLDRVHSLLDSVATGTYF